MNRSRESGGFQCFVFLSRLGYRGRYPAYGDRNEDSGNFCSVLHIRSGVQWLDKQFEYQWSGRGTASG